MVIEYRTRDGQGNDIIKPVEIKQFPVVTGIGFRCPICSEECGAGHEIKACVSEKFTDWSFFDGRYICEKCGRLFSLYPYSYTVENGKITMFNQLEIKQHLFRKHTAPFMFCITTSRKKHLFYRAQMNYSDEYFAVQLETETIFTERERLGKLFDFVENMQAIGVSKTAMANGDIPFAVLSQPFGVRCREILLWELRTSREIQIPLWCGVKRNIETEEAKKCIMDLIQTM